jgi:hypothetical protein
MISGTLACPVRANAGEPACGPDDAVTRAAVHELIGSPTMESFRTKWGIHAINPQTLRLLADSQDASACQTLRDLVRFGSYGRPVFYMAGGYYFAAAAHTPPPGTVPLRQVPVIVLNSSFEVLGVIGM